MAKSARAELARRIKQKTAPQFDLDKFFFRKQMEFFRSSGSRFRTAVCSRRAGKTVGIVGDAFDTCLSEPNSLVLYITMTKQNARNIIWADIERVKDQFGIDCKLDNTRLSVKFSNGSKIAIEGVKDRTEIEKYRGWKLRKCYIDECQSFKPYLKDLTKEVIIPALRDLRGELYLTGTPGPVPAGTFYEYAHSENWNNFKWTAFDNPFMHDPSKGLDLNETLREERVLFEIDETDPGYQRETYGIWVEDMDSLVYKFSKSRNVYKDGDLPDDLTYILGIDVGFNDADAIAVLGFSPNSRDVYLIEETVTPKQDITTLAEQVHEAKARYNPVKMVMDAGALGKKIQEELVRRYGLNIIAAEKTRKVEFIELLNGDLRQGRFKAFSRSIFQEDSMRVQWDRESRIRNPESPKISTVFHSDICDAVLYAWRECQHYLYQEPDPKYDVNTDEYMDQLEQKLAADMEERQKRKWWEPDPRDIEDFDLDLDYDYDE